MTGAGRGCDRHIFPEETECPHCGADVAAARARHEAALARRHALMARLEGLLDRVAATRKVAVPAIAPAAGVEEAVGAAGGD